MNLLLFIFQNNCFSMLPSYVDIINVVILNADKWTLPACFCCILLVSCLGKFLTVLTGLQLFSADRKYLSCLDHYSYICCLLHAFCLISPVDVSFWNYFWHAVFFIHCLCQLSVVTSWDLAWSWAHLRPELWYQQLTLHSTPSNKYAFLLY